MMVAKRGIKMTHKIFTDIFEAFGYTPKKDPDRCTECEEPADVDDLQHLFGDSYFCADCVGQLEKSRGAPVEYFYSGME